MALSRLTVSLIVLLGATHGLAQAPDSLKQFNSSIRELTRRISPAVVEITVFGYGTPDDAQPDETATQITKQLSNGSGVVVDSSGYIVTNAHVVDRAVGVRVILGSPTDGSRSAALRAAPPRIFPAHIVGIDRETDLALLKIDVSGLPAVDFGDSDSVAQGDIVLAIGSPLLLRNSVSLGVVSAPVRELSDEDAVLYIQTDASLNPGASGGALVDVNGKLIGLNTSILSKSGGDEGIGFAIPGNLVHSVVKQLRQNGAVVRGSLGLRVQTITQTLARALSLGDQHGVMVADADSDGSGVLAGIQRQDLITELDGVPVETARQFREMIAVRPPRTIVRLKVKHRSESLDVTARVEAWSPPPDHLALMGAPEDHLISRLGIFCVEIDQAVAAAVPGLRTQYGLIVVARSSAIQTKLLDLKPGDVIHELNNLPIASLETFREHINALERGDAVALQIERNGHFRYASFEIE